MFGMVCVDVLVSALCVLFVYITWGERERDFVNINILSLISILIFFFFFNSWWNNKQGDYCNLIMQQ